MTANHKKLIILSGLSGSGKTIALHTLEDAGYYCVDNLPVGLLEAYVANMQQSKPPLYDLIAVSIDARSGVKDMSHFNEALSRIKQSGFDTEIIFLSTNSNILLSRFSETRRKHPLSRKGLPLIEAIHLEKNILKPIFENADLIIDTSDFNVHQLRKHIHDRVTPEGSQKLAVLIQSFGFKYGTPTDTDFMFDVRCLTNPHWEPSIKEFTGQETPIIEFLEKQDDVKAMYKSIESFILQWIPKFESENRSYITISIGCTGGRHRSVYLSERLSHAIKKFRNNVTLRHRELA